MKQCCIFYQLQYLQMEANGVIDIHLNTFINLKDDTYQDYKHQ